MKWFTRPELAGFSHAADKLEHVPRSEQRVLYVEKYSSLPPCAATRQSPLVASTVSSARVPSLSHSARARFTASLSAQLIESTSESPVSEPCASSTDMNTKNNTSLSVSPKMKRRKRGAT